MGTAAYMAPEQVRGEVTDQRTDIFAFGAVLYEMLSGVRAFRRDTPAETMTAVLKEEPPEMSDPVRPIPAALERTVRRCLEKIQSSVSSRHEISPLRSVHFQEPRSADRCARRPRHLAGCRCLLWLVWAWRWRQSAQWTWFMARPRRRP